MTARTRIAAVAVALSLGVGVVGALVVGVKMGVGSRSACFKPAGNLMPHTSPVF